jgi:hypothetical protein
MQAAQEVLSLTVLKDGNTLTVGRRLMKPGIQEALQAAMKEQGIDSTTERQEQELQDMLGRLNSITPEETPEEDNIYAKMFKQSAEGAGEQSEQSPAKQKPLDN